MLTPGCVYTAHNYYGALAINDKLDSRVENLKEDLDKVLQQKEVAIQIGS